MYKFQKVQLNWKGITTDYDWMLVLESIEQLIDYHEKTMAAQIPATWKNLDEVSEHRAHINTSLGMMINFSSEAAEGKKSLIKLTSLIGGKIFEAKAKGILNTGKIYINKNGGYFPHSKDITVLEETFIEELIFPQYTLNDIYVKQWDGGTHWYAYVGGNPVEIDGENKWNTEEEAMRKAKTALFRLQNKHFHIKGTKIER